MGSDYWLALFGLLVICFSCCFGGCISGAMIGEKSGYTQCLQDMKRGNPPAYVLVEQADGTTKWESNKEKVK